MTLKLPYDPNQKHPLDAVESVVRLFEGLPRRLAEFALGGEIVPNLPTFECLSEAWLYDNLPGNGLLCRGQESAAHQYCTPPALAYGAMERSAVQVWRGGTGFALYIFNPNRDKNEYVGRRGAGGKWAGCTGGQEQGKQDRQKSRFFHGWVLGTPEV